MKVAILYNKFFDHVGNNMIVGGVETYLTNLAFLCQELGFETILYQWSTESFEKSIHGFTVKGVPLFHLYRKSRNQGLFDFACSEIVPDKDILIFGADHVSVPTQNSKHMSIQHGISWDLPVKYISSRRIAKYKIFAQILKKRAVDHYKKCFENCSNTVCVDYNFINWYRTTVPQVPAKHRIWVIPNFSAILPQTQVERRDYRKTPIKILFARRFVQMRGTRLFADVLGSLMQKYADIQCTFAGEGPDEEWLRSRFAGEQRISFTKYAPDESLDMHSQHDIAVVPSLASEGTSLSVAEAMATGCPVVATATGGITNMIINGYNGILTLPDTISLYQGIESLLENSELRRNIGTRGYETASNAFSLDRWKRAWQKALTDVAYGQ